MVHNGIEYGLMASYAEGLNLLAHANIGKPRATSTPRPLRCAIPSCTSTTSTSPPSPKCGGGEAWSRRGCSTSPRTRSASRRTSPSSRAACPTPARGGGRRSPRSTSARPRRSSPLRSTSGSRRVARPTSPTACLSAMRKEFGGHDEKPAESVTGTIEGRAEARRGRACGRVGRVGHDRRSRHRVDRGVGDPRHRCRARRRSAPRHRRRPDLHRERARRDAPRASRSPRSPSIRSSTSPSTAPTRSTRR